MTLFDLEGHPSALPESLGKLKRLYVKDLFGQFTYDISQPLPSDIIIFHGPNGYGKTVLLELLNSVVGGRFLDLQKYDFSFLRLSFEGGVFISVYHEPKEPNSLVHEKERQARRRAAMRENEPEQHYVLDEREDNLSLRVRFDYDSPGAESTEFSVSSLGKNIPHQMIRYMRDHYPSYREIYPGMLEDPQTGERVPILDFINEFDPRLARKYSKMVRRDLGTNYPFIEKFASSYFVETHRIYPNQSDDADYPEPGPRRRRRMPKSRIGQAADLIAARIQETTAEYSRESQRLDRKLPQDVISKMKDIRKGGRGKRRGSQSNENLRSEVLKRLEDLNSKAQRLSDAGLLQDENVQMVKKDDVYDELLAFLLVYCENTETKLAVFDDLYQKIAVFKDIVNSRLQFKSVEVSQAEGMEFWSDDGNRIPPNGLSSGEKHQVIQMFELIFNVSEGSFVFIDEPEISFHISWQSAFLEDIQRVSKLKNAQVFLATHSPAIIGDRWDLTVDLGNKNQSS